MGVEIHQSDLTRLEEMVQQANDGVDMELESRILESSGILNEVNFNRAVAYYFASNPDNTRWPEKGLTLDIINESNFRTTITGEDEIDRYCRTGVVTNHKTIFKDRKSEVFLIDYDIKLSLAAETVKEFSQRREMLRFRLKKRCVSLFGNVRVDLTIVKTNFRKTTSMAAALLNQKEQTYEAEVEYLPSGKGNSANDARRILERTAELSKALGNTEILMARSLELSVRSEYEKLSSNFSSTRDQRSVFIGPSTSTLKKENLKDLSIKNYSVTHKADGERSLVFAYKGDIFTINNRMTLKKTGLRCRLDDDGIFDAEVVELKYGKGIQIQIFDCYRYKELNVGINETFLERYKCIESFVSNVASNEVFEIIAKKFVISDTTWKAAGIIMKDDTKKFVYNTDGVIFTPVDTVVKAFGGTWNDVFKWKPPEFNTIDFLIKFVPETKTPTQFVTMQLFIGSLVNKVYIKKEFLIGDVPQISIVRKHAITNKYSV